MFAIVFVCVAFSLMTVPEARAQAVPSPWVGADIGGPSIAGQSASSDGRTFDVSAAGFDIWSSSDEFHFVYQPIDGDVEVFARVDAVSYAHAWSKAGVMIRSSLAANASHAYALVSAGKGIAFQRRPNTGSGSTNTSGPAAKSPYWVRLVRAGTRVTASVSTNGTSWTTLGSDTIALGQRAYVGIAVTSHNTSAATDTRVSQVTIQAQQSATAGLPAPFQNRDIGSPAVAGSTTHSSGTFTVRGAGADIWGTSDQFQYVYQPITGDVDIRARVASISYQNRWSKGGVMIRESLTAGSRHAYALMSAGAGNAFQRRVDPSGPSDNTSGWGVTPAGWVRLVRSGDRFEAFQSSNGTSWTSMGSEIIPMGQTVYAGLAVTSHNAGAATQVLFTNFSVQQSGTPSNQPPAVSVTSPANGATFSAPATFTVTASASDSDGTVSRVDFFRNGSYIATDTAAPYTAAVSSLAAGSYSFAARAYDDDGASTTSSGITVTVGSNTAPTVAITAPANGATFTAPASFTVTASASDANGTVARVEFYRGGTLIGTDTSSPYSASVSSLAAGTYTFTAVAYDNAGASRQSSGVSVTVAATTTPPRAVAFTASTDHATGVTRYVLEIFAAGANPSTATPIATSDLGKPTPGTNNEITVDRATFFQALAAGSYQAAVRADGAGGSSRSTPTSFTR
jgi:regulation of enolase protein 1 (concanavalin A-like superfamily)